MPVEVRVKRRHPAHSFDFFPQKTLQSFLQRQKLVFGSCLVARRWYEGSSVCSPLCKRLSSTETVQSALRLLSHTFIVFLSPAEMSVWTRPWVYVKDTETWLIRGMILSWIFAQQDISLVLGTNKQTKQQQQQNLIKRKVREVEMAMQSFNVLVREIPLHDHAPREQMRYNENVWYHACQCCPNSVVRTVDLSNNRQSVVCSSDALLLFAWLL